MCLVDLPLGSYVQIETGQIVTTGEFTVMFWLRLEADVNQQAVLLVGSCESSAVPFLANLFWLPSP